jgi:hypothetical protein
MEPNLEIILSSINENKNKHKFIRHTCMSAAIVPKEFHTKGANS